MLVVFNTTEVAKETSDPLNDSLQRATPNFMQAHSRRSAVESFNINLMTTD